MSRRTEKVFLSWVPHERGGRDAPPTGPLYSTVAHFEEDDTWPDEAWSLVVRLLKPVGAGHFWYAEATFLADDAPHQLLHPGSRFVLLEGDLVTGKGVVLPPDVPVPDEVSKFESALIG